MSRIARLFVLLGGLALLALPLLAQEEYTVGLGSSDELGSFLVGPNGMTVYSFMPDPIGKSVCNGKCAENWPPLTVESADAELTADEEVPGTLSTITRDDGTFQVAYNGIPLYYWKNDKAAGDTTGNYVGRIWFIIPPATVYAQRTATLGPVLVGPNGMTLYLFTKDTAGTEDAAAVSACYDKCATSWPPLTVESEDDIVPGVNLPGTWGTLERTDGAIQVTYNGWPLYYFAKDAAVGDTTGDKVGDVWYAVPQETLAVSSSDELGDFVTDPSGLTLYTFKNDAEGVSNCSGDCATAWPPYLLPETTRLTGSVGMEGTVALIEREEGKYQVTYNGMPLYYFKDDKAPDDATGQGVGDVWFVAAP
jgi:predicted lipoprotein with Yx(FWY)xxD motif